MSIKQISVFLENTPGKLAEFTKLLADNGIDLISICVADTTNYGIVRAIVADYERAAELIREAGFTVKLTDVLVVVVDDKPGGLYSVLSILAESGVGVEYIYSFVKNAGDMAHIVLRAEDADSAASLLKRSGVRMLSQDDIGKL